MIIPDVNLLLYAAISGFDDHDRARQWWEQTLSGSTPVGLADVVIFGFIRISTNRRVIDPPMTVEDAVCRVREWLARPNVRVLEPGPRHTDTALGLLADLGTAGNLTTDVQIAAYAMQQGGEVHSRDSDFSRFAGVTWTDPLRE